ncbi:MAG: nucleoside-diphosphate kinase [Bacilli bacterium]
MKEYTYVMLKPDGVELKLGELVVELFNKNDLLVLNDYRNTLLKLNKNIVMEHYAHLIDKPFYPDLEEFMLSGMVMPMVVYGENAVEKVRFLIGPTNVKKAQEVAPSSIRARFGNPDFGPSNVIHASDSPDNAIIEIERFFGQKILQPEKACVKRLNCRL